MKNNTTIVQFRVELSSKTHIVLKCNEATKHLNFEHVYTYICTVIIVFILQ